jgi:hypothetical protein
VWFQWFRKGVNGLVDETAVAILRERGLICCWWQEVGLISPPQIADKLTPDALRRHLDDYGSVEKETPFISLTAGVRMRATGTRGHGSNYVVSAQRTALTYATDDFQSPGHIFAGWVPVLPQPDVALEGFAEDVRDLTVYSRFRRFHRQGEVTAKIGVPTAQLAWVERWDLGPGPDSPKGRRAHSVKRWSNPRFLAPEGRAAVRDVL